MGVGRGVPTKPWELKSGKYDSRWLTLSTSLDPISIVSMYGIFTYIYHVKINPNVGKCTSPMDPWDGMGYGSVTDHHILLSSV